VNPTIDTSSPDLRARAAFEQWRVVNPTGPASRRDLGDWDVDFYRDAVCFSRPSKPNDVFMVRDSNLIHFGLDLDTYESAYQMIASAPVAPTTNDLAVRHFHQMLRPAYA